jgi:hypothetical protein
VTRATTTISPLQHDYRSFCTVRALWPLCRYLAANCATTFLEHDDQIGAGRTSDLSSAGYQRPGAIRLGKFVLPGCAGQGFKEASLDEVKRHLHCYMSSYAIDTLKIAVSSRSSDCRSAEDIPSSFAALTAERRPSQSAGLDSAC